MAFLEPFLLTNKPAPPEFLRPLPKPAPLLAPGRCNGFRAPPPLPPSYPFPGGPYGALYPGPYTPAPRVKLRPEPPQPPKRRALGNFTRGSLIRLASGELRRVEDMRTEDFVTSAERSPALRLDPSTVVRIQECPGGTARLTLSYGEYRTQVEFETGMEHPYFVLGQGWASCCPERTLQYYGLQCHRLQVGDVCVSLTPRTEASSSSSSSSSSSRCLEPPRKRRWSAPDDLTSTSVRRVKE